MKIRDYAYCLALYDFEPQILLSVSSQFHLIQNESSWQSKSETDDILSLCLYFCQKSGSVCV